MGSERSTATYNDYKKDFSALKSRDEQRSYGSELTLTADEKKLDSLMDAIRDTLIGDKYVYAKREEAAAEEPRSYPPIRPFYEVRGEIEANPLLDTFRRMPKGANLHIHTSATLKAEDFISLLHDHDNRCWSPGRQGAHYVAVKTGDAADGVLPYTPVILSRSSVPTGYTRLKDLSEIEEKTFLSMLTMSDDRIGGVKYIWDEFNNIFSRVKYVMKVRTLYQPYYTTAFKKMIDDNISHVELRFGAGVLRDDNEEDFTALSAGGDEYHYEDFPDSKNESVTEMYAAYKEAKTYAAEQGKTFTLKLILSASRKKTTTEPPLDSVRADLDLIDECNSNIKIYAPDDEPFIVGYDLVSEEDRGWNTDDIAQALFTKDGNTRGIPFFFHDGESCWANDDNLFSAISLNTTRIGHGINMYHFPDLVEEVKNRNMTIEVCPISNQILRYTQDLRTHPIAEYMKRGIDCVICNDDPQIFNYNGLAYDFWEIYFSQLIDLAGIKKLVFNSIDKSMLCDAKKKEQREALEQQWAAFVAEEIRRLQ